MRTLLPNGLGRAFLTSTLLVPLLLIPASKADLQQPSTANRDVPIAIAIHGGAGTITKANLTTEQDAAYRGKLDEALQAGYTLLQQGRDGQEAVVAAIQILEASPLFNAGKGAVYTYAGEHELDASIMHGKHRTAGAVAGVKTIASPIAAAQAVMNESEHVMLSGSGAETFASEQGLLMVPNTTFNTERRWQALQKAKAVIARDQGTQNQRTPAQIISDQSTPDQSTPDQSTLLAFQDYKFGTVGAVVLDRQGNLVAGTSTGGMTAKRYGRIGDSPVIGAGTFADNQSCAVSATGHGEYFIRYQVAADICQRMAYAGLSLAEAADTVINKVLVEASGSGGVIAVDSAGNIAMPFNTEGMYRASIDAKGNKTIRIYR